MSDNVQLPPTGTGTADVVAATDDVTGVHYPYVKLVDGTANSTAAIPGDATDGLHTKLKAHAQSSAQTATWTNATAADTALSIDVTKYASVSLLVATDAGTFTDGVIDFEVSNDGGTTWGSIGGVAAAGYDLAISPNLWVPILSRTLAAFGSSMAQLITFGVGGYTHFRVVLDTAILGTGTLSLRAIADTAPPGAVPSTLLADNTQAFVGGPVAAGAVFLGNPVVVAGLDAGNVAAIQVPLDGNTLDVPAGAVVSGWDGNQAYILKTDADGHPQVDVLTLPNVTIGAAIPAGNNNIGDVDVASIAAGDNNIGNVDIVTMPNVTLAAGTNTNEVVGDAAHNAAAAGNPLLVGGYASAAAPTDVGADGRAVNAWRLRNGAAATVITAAGALIGGDASNGLDVDVTRLPALVAGTANIGDVDVLTVPTDPFGANADAASATGSISAKLRFIAATGIPITGTTNVAIVPKSVYNYNIPSQVHVNSASTVHWDLFNADASLIVRVLSIRQIPNITTAVTGIVFDWLLERTTAVGTGGSTLTAWLADLSQTALDADITARSKPSGGATQSTDLFNYSLSSEETNAATIQVASQGGLELVPEPMRIGYGGQGIVLRQNQGIRCVQVTASAAGNTGWFISFIVE